MNKSVFSKSKLDSSKYVNIDTGESLSTEEPGITSINKITPDLKIISSKEYVVIDSQALSYITRQFSTVDLGNILAMADMVRGNYNIVYDNDIPHTKDTLRKRLDYSVNKFRDLLSRLYKGGVISYLHSYVNGKECKFIILNPYIARKQKTYHVDCLTLFQDFRKLSSEKNNLED